MGLPSVSTLNYTQIFLAILLGLSFLLTSDDLAAKTKEPEIAIPNAIHFFSLALEKIAIDPESLKKDFCQIKAEHVLHYLQQSKSLWDDFLTAQFSAKNKKKARSTLIKGLQSCSETCSCDLWETSLEEKDPDHKVLSQKTLLKLLSSERRDQKINQSSTCKKITTEFCKSTLFKEIQTQVLKNI